MKKDGLVRRFSLSHLVILVIGVVVPMTACSPSAGTLPPGSAEILRSSRPSAGPR
jgi:hypothetical protein